MKMTTNKRKVDALVFVGHTFEEGIDRVSHGPRMLGTPALLVQKGGDALSICD